MDSQFMQDQRKQIDAIDTQILELLGQRMRCSTVIGNYKKQKNLPIVQGQRWQELLSAGIAKGKDEGLTEEFATLVLHTVHTESVRIQNQILKN